MRHSSRAAYAEHVPRPTRRALALAVRVVIFLCVIGTASLSQASAAPASSARDTRACGEISVLSGFVRYSYTVQVEQGTVACEEATRLMYRIDEGPPYSPPGWHCSVGQDRRSWAISCTGHGSLVRAYGPTPRRSTWAQAAAQVTMHVEVPQETLGLSPTDVTGGKRCGGRGAGPDWVNATYSRPDGARLTIAEGHPYTCGQLGVPAVVAVWNIHGHAAQLSEYCGPTGCARMSGEWALLWSEHGIQITLLTDGLSQHELLAIARSMEPLQR